MPAPGARKALTLWGQENKETFQARKRGGGVKRANGVVTHADLLLFQVLGAYSIVGV